MGEDYYKLLEVNKDANDDELWEAFSNLAKKWHPNYNPIHMKKEAMAKFTQISEAYEVLNDSKKRAIYDRHGEEGLKSHVRPLDFDGVTISCENNPCNSIMCIACRTSFYRAEMRHGRDILHNILFGKGGDNRRSGVSSLRRPWKNFGKRKGESSNNVNQNKHVKIQSDLSKKWTCTTRGKNHRGECLTGQNKCFRCKQPGHRAHNCPRSSND